MNPIEQVLAGNSKYRIERQPPSAEEIAVVENAVGGPLPPGYLEFLRLGGLGDLRFTDEVLAPNEILQSLKLVSYLKLVPFASNGCGDLYCWRMAELPHSAVVFWDHDDSAVHESFESFESALQAWRD